MEEVAKKVELATYVSPQEESPKDNGESHSLDTGSDVPKEPVNDAADEKAIVPVNYGMEDTPAPNVASEQPLEKSPATPVDRDVVLARIATEKKFALVKAWEESEKTKAENKAHKKISHVQNWENSKKAAVEAELKKLEENLEKKKAVCAEKMKNKIARLHKAAEEKRAALHAKKGEDLLKIEETAEKFRAKGVIPKKILGCFSTTSSKC